MTRILGASNASTGRNNVVNDRKAPSLQSVAQNLLRNLTEGSASGGLYCPRTHRENACKIAAA